MSVCMKCLCEGTTNVVEIGGLGYGGQFDGFGTKVVLCDSCMADTNPEWWKLTIVTDTNENGVEIGEQYECEEEILAFIQSCPLEGQELFYNSLSKDIWGYPLLEPQEWIDYQLGTLPHEKCKEYGLFSPQELEAYKARFPICAQVNKYVFPDTSSGTSCVYGAWGGEDGDCFSHGSTACHECQHFSVRETPMEVIEVGNNQ